VAQAGAPGSIFYLGLGVAYVVADLQIDGGCPPTSAASEFRGDALRGAPGKGKVKNRTLGNHKDAAPKFQPLGHPPKTKTPGAFPTERDTVCSLCFGQ